MDSVQNALTEAERLLHETTKKKQECEALARRLSEEEEVAQMAKESLQQVRQQPSIHDHIHSLSHTLTLIPPL